MFSRTTLGNVSECRTECEISDSTGAAIAVVYESSDGWHVTNFRALRDEELAEFSASVEAAKQSLSRYVNRMGSNRPEELTAGGLSLWLMQMDDGTMLGIKLGDNEDTSVRVVHVPAEAQGRVRSLAQEGRRLEAIREIRMATNCSLAEAKAWLKDNC